MPAVVDIEKCEGCNDCEENCPNGSVKVTDGKAVVNEEECIDCQACVSVCLHQAITIP